MDLRTKYLLKASRDGDIENVRLCVSANGIEIINCEENGKSGRTPLYMAARNGYIQVVQFCVEHGAIVDKSTLDGWTPFLRAARKGFLDVVQFLSESGANTNKYNLNGNTALHLSSGEGHLHVVKYLLEGQGTETEIDKGDNNGWTALHWASCYGHDSIIEYLLIHGADGNKLDHSGCSPLHCAAEEGHLLSVLILLQIGKVDIDIRNDNGQLPSEVTSCEEIKAAICMEQMDRQSHPKATSSSSASSSSASSSSLIPSSSPSLSLSLTLPLPLPPSESPPSPPLLPRRPPSPPLLPLPPLHAHATFRGHKEEQRHREIQDYSIQGLGGGKRLSGKLLDRQGLDRQGLGLSESQKSTSSSTYATCRTHHIDSQKSIVTNKSTTTTTTNNNTNTNTDTTTNNTMDTNRSSNGGSPRCQKHCYDALSTVSLTDHDMGAAAGSDRDQDQGQGLKSAGAATESQKEKKQRMMDDED